MSHQAGIKASDHLRSFFAASKDGSVRLIEVAIKDEQLILESSAKAKGTWEKDWDVMIQPLLKHDHPTYIMFRLDEQTPSGYQWIFISYSPDFSPVRQKMLYAASKATLRNEFGSSHIKDEMFGTVPHDVNLDGYKKHLISAHAPKPLTFAEEELEMIKKNEVNVNISVATKHQTVQGVAFPISQQAIDQLNLLKSSSINYVQLSLDLVKEEINLETSGTVTVDEMRQKVPSNHARYHLYLFKHIHEGDQQISCVFIYTMPGYNCSIKERMLYSTCKGPLIDHIEKVLSIEIARKLEVDNANEITIEFLYDEIHPQKNIVKKQFEKPKGPAGRGPKRITKVADNE